MAIQAQTLPMALACADAQELMHSSRKTSLLAQLMYALGKTRSVA